MKNEAKSVDISGQKVVTMRDAQSALAAGASHVLIGENCVVTPSARDFLTQHNIALAANGKGKAAATAAYRESTTAPGSSEKDGNRGAASARLFYYA